MDYDVRDALVSVTGTVSMGTVGVVATVIVLGIGLTLPPPAGVSRTVQTVSAVFCATLVLWLTEPVPYAVSSILSVSLLYVLGVVDTFPAAVSGFASTLVFFLILLFLLGNAISNVELDEQIARRLLSTGSTPRQAFRSLAGNLLVLSFLMPSSVARAVAFFPVVARFERIFDLGPDSGFEHSAFLLLGHVNALASMALMTGGGMALTASEIIKSTVRPVTWVEWAILMVPPTMFLYGLTATAAERLYPIETSVTVGDAADASDAALEAESPSLTRDQRIVGVVMVGAVGSWIVGSFVGIPTIVPAVGAVFVLALPGIGLVTSEDVADVNWDIVLLIGTMLSLLDVMSATGTLDLVVGGLLDYVPFVEFSRWQTVAALLALAICIRVVFSTASAAILVILPVFLRFGDTIGINQLYLGLSIFLVVGATTVLPFNTTTVLLSLDRGPLSKRNVFAFGLVTLGSALLTVVLSWLLYWPLVTGTVV